MRRLVLVGHVPPSPAHSFDPKRDYSYIEYQSVCPLVGIGTPPPSPTQASVSPLLEPKGGGATLPCV